MRMGDPRQTAGYKSERRASDSTESSRLGTRLRNRFTMCFTSPSPPPRFPQSKSKSRSRTPMRESMCYVEDSAIPRHRDERLNLETMECNSTNFKAVLRECQSLRRKHEQLNREMKMMEKNATEAANACCSVINENNRKLRQTLQSTFIMDKLVQDLKSQIAQKDAVIRELQENNTSTPRSPYSTTPSTSSAVY
eukprot:g3702.t1